MRTKMKKILALLLAATSIVSIGTTSALSVSAATVTNKAVDQGSKTYISAEGQIIDSYGNVFQAIKKDENTFTKNVTLVSLSSKSVSKDRVATIPDKLDVAGTTYTVTTIGDGTHSICASDSALGITKLIIPNTVTTVSAKALSNGVLETLSDDETVIQIGNDMLFYSSKFKSFDKAAFDGVDTNKIIIQTNQFNVTGYSSSTNPYGYIGTLPEGCTFKCYFGTLAWKLWYNANDKSAISNVHWEAIGPIKFSSSGITDSQGNVFKFCLVPVSESTMTDTSVPTFAIRTIGNGLKYQYIDIPSAYIKKYFKKTADFDDYSFTLTARDSAKNIVKGSQTVTGLNKRLDISTGEFYTESSYTISKNTGGGYTAKTVSAILSNIIISQPKANIMVSATYADRTYTNNDKPGEMTLTATVKEDVTKLYTGSLSTKIKLTDTSSYTTNDTKIEIVENAKGYQRVKITNYDDTAYYQVDARLITASSGSWKSIYDGLTKKQAGITFADDGVYMPGTIGTKENQSAIVRVTKYKSSSATTLVPYKADVSYMVIHPNTIAVKSSTNGWNTVITPDVRASASAYIYFVAPDNTDKKYYITIYKKTDNTGEAKAIAIDGVTEHEMTVSTTGLYSFGRYYLLKDISDANFDSDIYYAVIRDDTVANGGNIVANKMVCTTNDKTEIMEDGVEAFKVMQFNNKGLKLTSNAKDGYAPNGTWIRYQLSVIGNTKYDLTTANIYRIYAVRKSDEGWKKLDNVLEVSSVSAYNKLTESDKDGYDVIMTSDHKNYWVKPVDNTTAYYAVKANNESGTLKTSNSELIYSGLVTSLKNTSTLTVNKNTVDGVVAGSIIAAGINYNEVPEIGTTLNNGVLKTSFYVKKSSDSNGYGTVENRYTLLKVTNTDSDGKVTATTDYTTVSSANSVSDLKITEPGTYVLKMQQVVHNGGTSNVDEAIDGATRGDTISDTISSIKYFAFKVGVQSPQANVSATSVTYVSGTTTSSIINVTQIGGKKISMDTNELAAFKSGDVLKAEVYDDTGTRVRVYEYSASKATLAPVINEATGKYTGFTCKFTPVFTSTSRKFTVVVSYTEGSNITTQTKTTFNVGANSTLKALANNSTVNGSAVTTQNVKVGEAFSIEAIAADGTETGYKYTVRYRRTTTDTWTTKLNDLTTSTTSIKPISVGTFLVEVTVKDSSNKTVTKTFTLNAIQ